MLRVHYNYSLKLDGSLSTVPTKYLVRKDYHTLQEPMFFVLGRNRRHRTCHPTHHSIQTQGQPVVVLPMWNAKPEYTTGHLMSWVRPDREILPRPSTHTPANAQLDAVMVVINRKLGRKYRTNGVLNPGPMVCESITLSARPQLLPKKEVIDLHFQII